MKRTVAAALAALMIFQLAGCESVQRKFTRKTKRKTITPRFYTEDSKEARPVLDLYKTHYTYWRTWHEDLVKNAGENAKRDKMAISEALGNLMDMKKYLKDQKAAQLQVHIDRVKELSDQIISGPANAASMGNIKRMLDNERARIARDFYYKKVSGDILPES